MKLKGFCCYVNLVSLCTHIKKKFGIWRLFDHSKWICKLLIWIKIPLHPDLVQFSLEHKLLDFGSIVVLFVVLEIHLGCLHVCVFRFQLSTYLVAYFLALFGPLGLLLLFVISQAELDWFCLYWFLLILLVIVYGIYVAVSCCCLSC